MTADLKATDLRAGDVVVFISNGEEWVVLWAEDDRLMPAGWPIGSVRLADCALRRKASDDEHAELMARVKAGDHPYRDRALRLYGATA